MTSADKTVTYTYNADGLRVSKTVDGVVHNYVYSGGKLVQETFGDTRLDFSYDAYGNPYTFSYTKGDGKTSVYHYVLNQQGDVVRIVTNKGVTRVTYEYDAWGNIINMTYTRKVLADTNPLCYRGYVYDHDTGLYYLQSRYYNPQTGRFLNADAYTSTGQGFIGNNMFTYCLNNPVNGYDPCGTCFHRWDFWNDCNRCREYGPCGTASIGISLGFSVGPWSYAIQLAAASDMDGNSEFQFTYAGTLSSNTPSVPEMSDCKHVPQVTAAASIAFTNAPNVSNLHGEAHQVGGALAGVGVDVCFLPDHKNDVTYTGLVYSAGLISPDVHYTGSTTTKIASTSFNVFNYFAFALDLLGGKYQ